MSFSFDEIVKATRRWRDDAVDGVKSAATGTKQKAEWVWESLQGDFNPNRSLGQVGFDAAVCLVPGVDTVMDIRDLIANIIAIVAAPTSPMAWFNLVLTIIGFIPGLGSVAKGVVKIVFTWLRPLIKHADDLTHVSKMRGYLDEAFDAALPALMQYLTHPKVQQFLTKVGVPDVARWCAKSIRSVVSKINPDELKRLFTERAGQMRQILETLRPLLPEAAGARIKQVLDGVNLVHRQFVSMVDQFMAPMQAVMLRLAERLDEIHWVAYTQQVNKGWIAPLSEQGAKRLVAKHRPAWVKTEGVIYEQLSPDKFRKRAVYKDGVKQGAPDLDNDAIKSFAAGVKARSLKSGETLYRVVDPTSGSLSTCWITESVWKEIIKDPAKAREVWRGKLAVKPDWNQNGTYIKYTYNEARDGKIVVWEGPTAVQYMNPQTKNPSEGFLEGGLNQVVFDPGKQIRDVKPDTFAIANPDVRGVQFPDMVEGGIIRYPDGSPKRHGVREKINDPRVEGPFETGWGYKDFEEQHDIIGLPNPMKE